MRDLLLAAIVFGLVPVCFLRPWIGFLIWTWIGMMSPHWLMFGFARDIQWAMIAGGATLAGLLFTRDKKSLPWNTQLVLMAVLLAYFTFTTLFAWAPDAAWEKWNLVMKVIVMAILATMVIYGRDRVRWLLIVIALSIGYYGIKGGIWVIATGGAERVYGPSGGFMTQSNGIGVGLLMVVPIMLALAREQPHKWRRWFFNLAAGLSTISVIFTYSRGAMLGMAASAPFMFMRSKRKFLAALVLAPVIVAGVLWAPDELFERWETIATYQEDRSAMQRIQAWIVAWNIAVESPLTGAGFHFESSPDIGRWLSYGDPAIHQYLGHAPSAHSIYFQMLGEHGFVAFGLYLWLIFSTLWQCRRLAKRTAGDPELEWIGNYASAIRICLIGYMVSGAFLNIAYFDLAWVYYSFTAILSRELPENAGTTQKLAMSGSGTRAQTAPATQGGRSRALPASGPRSRKAGV